MSLKIPYFEKGASSGKGEISCLPFLETLEQCEKELNLTKGDGFSDIALGPST